MEDDEEHEFDKPLRCPVCGRTAEGDCWPTHARHGCRMCPTCAHEGLGMVIPAMLFGDEAAEFRAKNPRPKYRGELP